MKTLKSTIVSLLFLLATTSYAGGGWVNKKYEGYFKLSQNIIRAPDFFASNGDLVSIPTTSLYTTSIYGEYGITDWLTGVAYVPFFVRATQNEVRFNQSGTSSPGDAINSFGDTNLGLKAGLFQDKPVVLAASLTVGLPFGESEVTNERILQTGDGEVNFLSKLEVSHSFYPVPVYATLTTGFNIRTKGFSEEVHLGAEVGFVRNSLVATMKFYTVQSLFNGNAGETQANGIFANNIEYVSLTPEISYLLGDKFGVSASAGFAFSGKQILAAPNFGLGVFLNI